MIIDGSAVSLGFLAALCLHHSDHGAVEDRAFAALEKNSKEGIPLLLNLLENGQSICTIGQSADALARLKVAAAVDLLLKQLPADVRFGWVANIAESLALLGNDKAVPGLIKLADVTHQHQLPKDDPMNMSGGRLAARFRAIVAMGAFGSQKKVVRQELEKGLKNPQVSSACLAGLFRLTKDKRLLQTLKTTISEQKDTNLFLLLITLEDANDTDLNTFAKEIKSAKEETKQEKATPATNLDNERK